jgi:hypothetical protein
VVPDRADAPAVRRRRPELEPEPETETILAVLSQVTRRGEWEPSERVRVFACMGRAVLDFRKAILPPGVTEIRALSLMGTVKIIVPPELDVEINGSAFLGRLDHKSPHSRVKRLIKDWIGSGEPETEVAEEDAPFLRIRCTALLGDISLRVV